MLTVWKYILGTGCDVLPCVMLTGPAVNAWTPKHQ